MSWTEATFGSVVSGSAILTSISRGTSAPSTVVGSVMIGWTIPSSTGGFEIPILMKW